MGRKIKEWKDVIGKKNLIAICVLILLLIILGVSCSLSDSKKKADGDETKKEDEIGLQVQENADDAEDAEGSEFTDYVPSEDEKKDDPFYNEGTTGNKNTQSNDKNQTGLKENEKDKIDKDKGETGKDNETENEMQPEYDPSDEGFGALF